MEMQFKTELIHAGTLSPRETEVMLLVCSAFTDKDIGSALAISLNTVARHLEMIYIKLGVHGVRLNRRVSMTRVALAEGMVRFVPPPLGRPPLRRASPRRPV